MTSIPVGENSRIMRLFSIGEDPYVIMRETETDPETGKTEMWNVIYEVSVQEKSLKPSTFSEYTPANAAPNSLYSTMSLYCKNGSSWNFITYSERDERTQQIRQKNDLVFVDKDGEVIIERDLAELMGEENADVQQAFGDEERVIFLDYSSNLYKVNAAGERVSKINLNESAGGRFNISCMV